MEASSIGTKHQPQTHARGVRNDHRPQPSGDNPRKKDSVTISEDGKKLSERNDFRLRIYDGESGPLVFIKPDRQISEHGDMEAEELKNVEEIKYEDWIKKIEYEKNGYVRGKAEDSIFSFLDGKVKNAQEVAKQLGIMLFSQDTVGWAQLGESPFFAQQNIHATNPETRAANREAARELAKYIAENYIDNPDEAQAFIDKINKYIEDSEKLDKGYVDWGKGLVPPDPMSDDDKWLMANWDKYFSHLNVRATITEYNTLCFDLTSVSYDEFREAMSAALKDRMEESMAYAKKNNPPYKFWPDGSGGPSWEERKDINCDPRHSQYSEQNKAWYKEFFAKGNFLQDLINKAKSTTDFSGNERWNIVMNLLS